MPMHRLVGLVNEIKPVVDDIIANQPEKTPSYFEILVALSFLYFAQEKVDFAVVEVGLGGRLDATNVLTPEISVITNVGLDHTEILGNTIERIAGEKAGIIKRNTPVVTAAWGKALEVIQETAKEKQATLYKVNTQSLDSASKIDSFRYISRYYDILKTIDNPAALECALLALSTIFALNLPIKKIDIKGVIKIGRAHV